MGSVASSIDRRNVIAAIILIFIGAGIALGGPVQVYFSKYFWCGRVGAGFQLHVFEAIAAFQMVIFLFAQTSKRIAIFYRWSQWTAVTLCAPQLILLVQAYPITFSLLALALALSFGAAIVIAWFSDPQRKISFHFVAHSQAYFVSISFLILLHWLIVTALISQFFLYRPAVPLTTIPLTFCLMIGAAAAVAGGWSFHRRNGNVLQTINLEAFAPFSILLLALLRAKYGDGAFDTLLYKGTWPYQIAEWRTAGMAILDSVGLGSNFQEMFNGLLCILSSDYTPSLISTLSIGALFMVLPCCVQIVRNRLGFSQLIAAVAVLEIVSFTEAAAAQGTAYQEPFLVLLMTVGLLNARTWPLFVSAAIATKLTVISATPLFFVYRFALVGRLVLLDAWKRRYVFVAAASLIVFLVSPQLDRNLIYSGRVLGLTETLASLTDAAGPHAIMAPGGSVYFASLPRGGLWNNFIKSTCNVFALELICDVAYHGDPNIGFHILPSSRVPIIGVFLAVVIVLYAALTRARFALVLTAAVLFLAGYIIFLAQVTQGRYFLIPSFMFVVLLLCISAALSDTQVLPSLITGRKGSLLTVLLALIPIGDLLAGTFINDGWNCRRDYLDHAPTYSIIGPRNSLEGFLAEDALKYKKACPPPGLPPTIIVQPHSLVTPYLGVPLATSGIGNQMRQRFFQVDPNRAKRIPFAVLAFVLRKNEHRDRYTFGESAKFKPCFESKNIEVLCSLDLAPNGSDCAHSAYDGFNPTRVPGQEIDKFKFN
jgi:hypothetical protein